MGEQNVLRFDVARYSQWRAAYRALAVERWSWNGRDTSLTYQTEFFSFYRTLGFHHALAILREHVLAEVSRLLNRNAVWDWAFELALRGCRHQVEYWRFEAGWSEATFPSGTPLNRR